MDKNRQKIQRQKRVRRKLRANGTVVRLSVHRSNQYISAQLIDDSAGKTLAFFSEQQLGDAKKGTRMERAHSVGMELAKKAKEKKVTVIVFDKGSYAYHGRVKAVAEGAREGGLDF
jgi:large subunit ribosomal protein L18